MATVSPRVSTVGASTVDEVGVSKSCIWSVPAVRFETKGLHRNRSIGITFDAIIL